MTISRDNQRGSALVVVMVVITVLAGVISFMLADSVAKMQVTATHVEDSRCFHRDFPFDASKPSLRSISPVILCIVTLRSRRFSCPRVCYRPARPLPKLTAARIARLGDPGTDFPPR